MKKYEHNIKPSILKAVASKELQEEIEKELANATEAPTKQLADILEKNQTCGENCECFGEEE